MTPTMTMRVNDTDANLIRKFAKFEGKSISDLIRDAVFAQIEDGRDLAALRAAIEKDDGKRYSQAEILEELCF